MSRIGKMPVVLSDKIEATINGNNIKIKWPLWELSFDFSDKLKVTMENNQVIVTPIDDNTSAIWGTTRSIINNLVIWVSEWFKKSLEINGVGYKFEVSWDKLVLSIWFSHKVDVSIPKGLKIVLDEKSKNIIHISGIDKQFVWEFASKIRAKKKPEPYKGKWIKYVWEHIVRKAGKTGSK